jgi:hypothetical protein
VRDPTSVASPSCAAAALAACASTESTQACTLSAELSKRSAAPPNERASSSSGSSLLSGGGERGAVASKNGSIGEADGVSKDGVSAAGVSGNGVSVEGVSAEGAAVECAVAEGVSSSLPHAACASSRKTGDERPEIGSSSTIAIARAVERWSSAR